MTIPSIFEGLSEEDIEAIRSRQTNLIKDFWLTEHETSVKGRTLINKPLFGGNINCYVCAGRSSSLWRFSPIANHWVLATWRFMLDDQPGPAISDASDHSATATKLAAQMAYEVCKMLGLPTTGLPEAEK
jgi:hypothetical protein